MSSVKDFADSLFREEPKSRGTINLDIDVSEQSEFFEVLLLIMTYGMKKWYGDRINIGQIDLDRVALLQQYFLSFGVQLHLDRVDEPAVYMIDNSAYLQKRALADMTFSVAANKHIYTVRFAFAPGVDVKW